MASKVEGMEKLKRFHFKLMERLSYTVLHSLINDCKNKKGVNNGKLKKVQLRNDIGIHITHLNNTLKL